MLSNGELEELRRFKLEFRMVFIVFVKKIPSHIETKRHIDEKKKNSKPQQISHILPRVRTQNTEICNTSFLGVCVSLSSSSSLRSQIQYFFFFFFFVAFSLSKHFTHYVSFFNVFLYVCNFISFLFFCLVFRWLL